jgi:hypothetical protein
MTTTALGRPAESARTRSIAARSTLAWVGAEVRAFEAACGSRYGSGYRLTAPKSIGDPHLQP